MTLQGRTAVITGSAGGIGRAIANSLARRGCHLALADIDDIALASTATELAAHKVRISRHHLDVSDRAAIAAFPQQVTAEHPGVDILVNNAGVALGGTFEQVTEADFDWLLSINFWGVVRMTRAFLPLLHKSEEARIVNISSIFGIIAPPGQTAYAASKFAVRGFSESLRHELSGTRIGVTVVHPGGVATSIAKNARVAGSISEQEAAERGLSQAASGGNRPASAANPNPPAQGQAGASGQQAAAGPGGGGGAGGPGGGAGGRRRNDRARR